MKLPWPTAALLLLLPGFLLSQSLGDIAEQEKAKRKKTGAKSYTNDDLAKPTPTPSPSPSDSPSPQPRATPRTINRNRFKVDGETPAPPQQPEKASLRETPSSDTESVVPQPAKSASDEAHWRGEREARENAVKTAESAIKELEQRMAELGSDLNPNSADVMDPDRLKKRDAELRDSADQLERSKAALAAAQKRLADLDEEARRAGVPPGWVR